MKKMKAFTLIELLVVIAIIGILSTVVVVNLSSSQVKAREASVLATMKSVQTAAISCVSAAKDLKFYGTSTGGAATATVKGPVAGYAVCSDTDAENTLWPSLGSNGAYSTTPADNTSSGSAGTFQYKATASGSSKVVTCDQSNCKLQ